MSKHMIYVAHLLVIYTGYIYNTLIYFGKDTSLGSGYQTFLDLY